MDDELNFVTWQDEADTDSDYEMNGQALPVTPFKIDEIDLSSVPLTAQEYLQQVITERRKLPAVVTASVPTLKSRSNMSTTCHFVNEKIVEYPFKPTKEWQQKRIARFAELRNNIDCNRECWEQFNKTPLPRNKSEWFEFLFSVGGGKQPYLDIVLKMNNETVENVIKYLIEWISDDRVKVHETGTWLFALLAALEVPVCITLTKTLRTLVHKCRNIRQILDIHNAENQNEITAATLFICIVTNYFGQRDLSD